MKVAPIVALIAAAQATITGLGSGCTTTAACNTANAGACCAKFWTYMEATPATLPAGWVSTTT